MTTTELLRGIDWALLRHQKRWLLDKAAPEAFGLLELLDACQDCAVDEFGTPEVEVFGPCLACQDCGVESFEEEFVLSPANAPALPMRDRRCPACDSGNVGPTEEAA